MSICQFCVLFSFKCFYQFWWTLEISLQYTYTYTWKTVDIIELFSLLRQIRIQSYTYGNSSKRSSCLIFILRGSHKSIWIGFVAFLNPNWSILIIVCVYHPNRTNMNCFRLVYWVYTHVDFSWCLECSILRLVIMEPSRVGPK